MARRRTLVIAPALACAIAAGAGPAAAGTEDVALPSTGIPLSEKPPLLAGAQQIQPVFRGRISSHERVTALIGGAGSVHGVRVVQRLVVGRGDYFFTVPAPVLDVQAAPGSESQPGLRPDAILWQGFSPGGRVLAARATLRVPESSPSLPLSLEVNAAADSLDVRVRIVNRTTIPAKTFGGLAARPIDVARMLDRIRTVCAGNKDFTPFLRVRTPLRSVTLPVEAPLRVEGTIVVPARRGSLRIRVSRLLGDGHPLAFTVHARRRVLDARPPKIDLTVRPVTPQDALRPPGGRSWVAALNRGHTPGAQRLLAVAVGSLLRLARVAQYETYLTNPDAAGANEASYRYVSAKAAPRPPVPSPRTPNEGVSSYTLLAVGLGALLAVAALAVLWSRS